MSVNNIAKKLVNELNDIGIEAYIWHSATTGSAYIRFQDNRMCSIRIADHEGRSQYNYKYNIRKDCKKPHWKKQNGVWRYYIPLNRWKEIIPVLKNRHETIQSWPQTKYSYNIPKFKQNESKNIHK